MKSVDGLKPLDARGVLPGWAVAANPPDEILQLLAAAKSAGVQDLGHVVLLLAINYRRGWRVGLLSWERIIGGMLQQGYVEYRVDAHGLREA